MGRSWAEGKAPGHPVLLQRWPCTPLPSSSVTNAAPLGSYFSYLQILIYTYAKNKLCPGLMEYAFLFFGRRIHGFYLAIAQRIFFWENENEFLAKTMFQRLSPALETQPLS